jgi:hypothetical protein
MRPKQAATIECAAKHPVKSCLPSLAGLEVSAGGCTVTLPPSGLNIICLATASRDRYLKPQALIAAYVLRSRSDGIWFARLKSDAMHSFEIELKIGYTVLPGPVGSSESRAGL